MVITFTLPLSPQIVPDRMRVHVRTSYIYLLNTSTGLSVCADCD